MGKVSLDHFPAGRKMEKVSETRMAANRLKQDP